MSHPIKPVTKTYNVSSFEVSATLDTRGKMHSLAVFFFDDKGLPVPPSMAPVAKPLRGAALAAAMQEISATPTATGESATAWLLRAAAPFVAKVYGVSVS
jgi:hypothetical protein